MDISDVCGRRRVHRGADRGHRRGENTSDNESEGTCGNMKRHIPRQNGVRVCDSETQLRRTSLEEHIDGGTHEEKEQSSRNTQESVGVHALAGLFLSAGSEISLDDRLIGAVCGDISENSGNQHRPHSGLAQVELK